LIGSAAIASASSCFFKSDFSGGPTAVGSTLPASSIALASFSSGVLAPDGSPWAFLASSSAIFVAFSALAFSAGLCPSVSLSKTAFFSASSFASYFFFSASSSASFLAAATFSSSFFFSNFS